MTSIYTPSPAGALAAAHAVLMAAIQGHQGTPPGPLLNVAVEVADALEAVADAEGGEQP